MTIVELNLPYTLLNTIEYCICDLHFSKSMFHCSHIAHKVMCIYKTNYNVLFPLNNKTTINDVTFDE